MFRLRTRRARRIVTDDVADRRFTIFGGRRQYRGIPYPLPKDMEEIQRLDFQHFLLRTGFGGNFAAPINTPGGILDVGTGSGRWAMEMAALFPQANVIGVDLVEPTSPESQVLGHGLDQRPGNYTFVAGNVLEGLPFADRTFDFVHQRLLITAIPADRWSSVLAELVRVTRPGGWVELAECGVPQEGGPGLTGLWATWIELCAQRGVDFTIGRSIGERLRGARLGDVKEHMKLFPMGAWGGRIGRASATDCLAVGAALRPGVIGLGIATEPEYDRLFALAKEEFAQPRGSGVLPFYLTYGQRPPQ